MINSQTAQVFEIEKDPAADLDYGFDWSDWLGPTDAIASSSWDGQGLSIHDTGVAGKKTGMWLSGGPARIHPYRVRNTVVSVGGRTDVRTLLVTVKER